MLAFRVSEHTAVLHWHKIYLLACAGDGQALTDLGAAAFRNQVCEGKKLLLKQKLSCAVGSQVWY